MADTAFPKSHSPEIARRDFLTLTTLAVGAVGVGSAIWPFISSMNPAKDALALASTEVDLSPVQVGQRLTVTWRGKPVFIDHRSPDEVKKAEWLVVVGVCTHLGCIPLGQKTGDEKGAFGGWFCPCHGSVYDTSGRIRQGPAPQNLLVPPYAFTGDTSIKIG
jgi:ubiquinol-cytochrome c reductase iron-sulfur subunit